MPHIKQLLSLACIALASISTFANADTVTVYSARNEQLLKPILDRYSKESGTEIKLLTANEGALLARLNAEGASTPADVLITVDAGNLWLAAQQGQLRAMNSAVLQKNIPAHLRDPDNQWFGLSVRARTIVYSKSAVRASELSSYEDLAQPKWKGRLCLRTSKKVYNQSLIAMMITELGEAKTEEVVRGWVANLVTTPFPDDTSLLKAIAAGQCQVGIVNTYYLGRILVKEPDFPVALFWANQSGSGTHVNVSGAGITKHAKNPLGAQKLIEYLSMETAQSFYVDEDLEFPANPKVKPNSIVKDWGSFKPNLLNVSKAGELQAAATKLMDRAGYK
ncbi:MAG: extracellular solute-binding protein [Oxalobacteraceae bacterium]|nr:extracellular solute-binding protein [Oxalobacteraceae bacterium]